MGELNDIIHQPVRLKIMASLSVLRAEDKLDFGFLKTALDVTDGNLGSHLQKLEEAGFIQVEKAFVGKRPKTYLTITNKGRAAFESHVEALKAIID